MDSPKKFASKEFKKAKKAAKALKAAVLSAKPTVSEVPLGFLMKKKPKKIHNRSSSESSESSSDFNTDVQPLLKRGEFQRPIPLQNEAFPEAQPKPLFTTVEELVNSISPSIHGVIWIFIMTFIRVFFQILFDGLNFLILFSPLCVGLSWIPLLIVKYTTYGISDAKIWQACFFIGSSPSYIRSFLTLFIKQFKFVKESNDNFIPVPFYDGAFFDQFYKIRSDGSYKIYWSFIIFYISVLIFSLSSFFTSVILPSLKPSFFETTEYHPNCTNGYIPVLFPTPTPTPSPSPSPTPTPTPTPTPNHHH